MPRPTGHPDNRAIGGIGADISWANTDDRAARTANARQSFNDTFLEQAREKYGDLPPDELARRAEHLRRAHFKRMALRSAQARRKKAGAAA